MFKSILSSVPHNKHYLFKYTTFIAQCQLNTEGNISHHICPRAMFPQYKSFSEHPWNRVCLTHRQHFIAHLLLWKAFPENDSMSHAAIAMAHKDGHRVNSVLYEKLMLDTNTKSSIRMKRRTWIKKDNTTKNIHLDKLQDFLKDGWERGRLISSSHAKKISIKAKQRYEDSTKNPRYGTKITEETREKISKSQIGKSLSDETRKKISKSSIGKSKPKSYSEKLSNRRKNTVWITDGYLNQQHDKASSIPEGWRRGLTKKR